MIQVEQSTWAILNDAKGEFPNGSFSIQNHIDESNDFFAKYEVLAGAGNYPTLKITNHSIPTWSAGEAKLLASGVVAKSFEISIHSKGPRLPG